MRDDDRKDLEKLIAQISENLDKDQKDRLLNAVNTGADWFKTLTKAEIKISMPLGDFSNHLPVTDGRGRYLDNMFIERLWRSLKQEAVYLHEITNGFHAKRIIDD